MSQPPSVTVWEAWNKEGRGTMSIQDGRKPTQEEIEAHERRLFWNKVVIGFIILIGIGLVYTVVNHYWL